MKHKLKQCHIEELEKMIQLYSVITIELFDEEAPLKHVMKQYIRGGKLNMCSLCLSAYDTDETDFTDCRFCIHSYMNDYKTTFVCMDDSYRKIYSDVCTSDMNIMDKEYIVDLCHKRAEYLQSLLDDYNSWTEKEEGNVNEIESQ